MQNYKQKDIDSWEEGFLPFEKDSNKQCGSLCDGWVCTRTKHHEDLHAAHVSGEMQTATWSD